MKCKDDMSYINQGLINRGLMRAVPFQIRFDRFFTEEEMKANRAYAENHSAEEWSEHCDEARRKIAAENEALMEYLNQYFAFGQYKQPYNYKDEKNFTFWFWCNDLYNTTNGKMSGRDYSYITLSFLEEGNNIQEHENIFARVKELLESYPAQNIQAIFQYSQVENTAAVTDEAERIFSLCEGKFINYGSYTGKLERYEDGYIFKKKNAKKYFYKVTPIDVCENVVV